MTKPIARRARAVGDALLSANPLAQLSLILAAIALVLTVVVARDIIGDAFVAVWRVL